MPYRWEVARNGSRRYVRVQGDTRIERISEGRPRRGAMAIEPPDGTVVAKVETTDAEIIPVADVDVEAAAVAVPTTPKKAPAKRRGTRKKKS